MIERRTLLAATAATAAALATRALALDTPPAVDVLGVALDEAATLPPAEGLRRLAGFEGRRLPTGRRLDLSSARAGLLIDAALLTAPDDYALRLQRTVGRVAPDAAEARVQAALDDLLHRANATFGQIGLRNGSVGARFEQLFAEEHFLYADSDAGRDAAVADMNRTMALFRREAARRLPAAPQVFNAAARRLTDDEIAAGKGGFREVPGPGHPGAYIVDLKDVARRPAWSLKSVAAHELIPGHMVQLGMEAIQPPHALRLTYAAAFMEGWAVHAETLAAAWSLMAEPREQLGHLHWLIFRAARGLIDLKIHRHGWTRARAHDALAEWQGVPVYFAPFDGDLKRIETEPGTRAAEAMAWLSIRSRAPDSPAALRRYHQQLLADGRRRIEDLP